MIAALATIERAKRTTNSLRDQRDLHNAQHAIVDAGERILQQSEENVHLATALLRIEHESPAKLPGDPDVVGSFDRWQDLHHPNSKGQKE